MSLACVRPGFGLKVMGQKKNRPSRPQLLLPIFVSNADEQDAHSVNKSCIYKLLYSELKTALSLSSYVCQIASVMDGGFGSIRRTKVGHFGPIKRRFYRLLPVQLPRSASLSQ